MGVRAQISTADRVYTVVDDITSVYQVLFTSALLEETTGSPLLSTATLRSDLPGVQLRLFGDGLVAGTGYLDRVLPNHASLPYSWNAFVTASGYRDSVLAVTIPAAAPLPVSIPSLVMRRTPIRLQGRVVKASDRSPIPAAVVSSKNNKALLLRSVVRSQHTLGVTVNAISLSNVGASRKLTTDVARGSTTAVLDNNAGLAPGAHLQFGSDVIAEIYDVKAIGPNAGQVQFNGVLNSSFLANTPVQEVSPSAPITTATLSRSADPGDGVLLVGSALTDKAVEISDGAQSELHFLNAISDSGGYYQVNGVTGVKTLELLCNATGFITADQGWFPVYSDAVNVVDFRLTP